MRPSCGSTAAFPGSMVVKLKRVEGGMTADGCPLRSIDRLRAGQTVRVRMPEDAVRIEGADMPLDVVYEDADLLVINKPPYLAVHPSAGKPEPTWPMRWWGTLPAGARRCPFGRSTGWTAIPAACCWRPKAPMWRMPWHRSRRRCTWPLCWAALAGEGVIDQPIRVREGSCITREVGEGGKPSLTRWHSLGTDGTISLLRVVIETGRTHQIRVHMAWLGYPLAGDTMYGTDDTVLPRHGLHCARMSFCHPVTGQPIALTCPLPPDMRALLERHGLWRPELDCVE